MHVVAFLHWLSINSIPTFVCHDFQPKLMGGAWKGEYVVDNEHFDRPIKTKQN